MSNEFATAIEDRYFDDYVVGSKYEFPEQVEVTEQEIVAFGRSFDPQSFHVDPQAAGSGPFQGLIASGWHTAGLMMRLYAKSYLSHVASLGGPGVDELRWPAPVRPGDRLRLRTTVLEARVSRSKPDRGLVRTLAELLNQDDVIVFRAELLNFLAVR